MQVFFTCIKYVYFLCFKTVRVLYGWLIMGIAYHKKTNKKYIQYTLRIEETILERIKDISTKEDLSINEVINQSLQDAIDTYKEK